MQLLFLSKTVTPEKTNSALSIFKPSAVAIFEYNR